MMGPLYPGTSLQMALTAVVCFMVVLTTYGTKECTLQMAEKLKRGSVFLSKTDIKLIQIACMEDSCRQSNDESKKIEKAGVDWGNEPKVQTERCGSVICKQTSKCVENGHEKSCVEASKTYAVEDRTVPSKPVTTQDFDPHAGPSQARGRDLHHASRVGDLERVKRILAAGHVDINSRHIWGKTPLMVAAEWGYTDVVGFLVGRGADVTLVDRNGDNALHFACEGGHLETVKLILSLNKVDVNNRNKYGKTAADYARDYRRQQVLDLLVSRDAH